MLADKIYEQFVMMLEDIVIEAQAEVRAQGHVASGRGVKSIEKIINRKGTALEGIILAEEYMVGPVNEGVSASRVPYSPGSGRRTSRYIQALIDWIQKYIRPSFSDSEAKSFAFAIAKTAKKEGHPTRGSFSFSQNGRRTGWIENGIIRKADDLEKRLRLFAILRSEFGDALRKAAE